VSVAGDDRYLVGGLMRGLDVLRCFDRDHPTLSLGEIARRLGWRRTEPFRFLHTLESLGYLRRDPVTKRYELTPKVLEIGFSALANLQLPELAQPYLERLRDQTSGSAHVGILDGKDVVYVGRAPARSILSSTIHIGSRLPAHATAIGKTLLAAKSDRWIRAWLAANDLTRYTVHTLAETRAFLDEIGQIRRRGFAVSNQEFEFGIRSVAAPIRNGNSETIAAINVSASADTLTAARVTDVVVPAVRATAVELSQAYGWRSDTAASSAGDSQA
jgi:IclR family transcriptional regulator, pca regulon regulatory protein